MPTSPSDTFETSLSSLPSTAVPPATFFAVTFVLSWLVWIPLVLSHFGVEPFTVLEAASATVRLLGVLMPAVAALALTWRYRGPTGARGLLDPLTTWRVGWRWWAAAVAVFPVLLVVSGAVYNALGGTPPVSPVTGVTAGAVAASVFFLVVASLGEELGWRGLALPALELRYGAFRASVVLAVLSATWHVPFWLLLDTLTEFGLPYLALNYLFFVGVTFYVTWLYNHARFSLLVAVLFHVTFNLVNVVWLPVTGSVGAFAVVVALTWVLAVVVSRRLVPRER